MAPDKLDVHLLHAKTSPNRKKKTTIAGTSSISSPQKGNKTRPSSPKKKGGKKKKTGKGTYDSLVTPPSYSGTPLSFASTFSRLSPPPGGWAGGRPETPSAALVEKMRYLQSRGPTPTSDVVRGRIGLATEGLVSKIEAVENALRASASGEMGAGNESTAPSEDIEEVYAHRLQFLLELQNRMGIIDRMERERFQEEGIQCYENDVSVEMSEGLNGEPSYISDVEVEEDDLPAVETADVGVGTHDTPDGKEYIACRPGVDFECQTDLTGSGESVADAEIKKQQEEARIETVRGEMYHMVAEVESRLSQEKEEHAEELDIMVAKVEEVTEEASRVEKSYKEEMKSVIEGHESEMRDLKSLADDAVERASNAENRMKILEEENGKLVAKLEALQKVVVDGALEFERAESARLKEIHELIARGKKDVRERYFEALKLGCLMFKCKRKRVKGLHRPPGLRWVFITQNLKEIHWHKKTDGSGKDRKSLSLAGVSRIVYGAKTMSQILAKRSLSLPTWLSFSLVFSSGETLDLIAPDESRLVTWLLGLQVIVAKLKGRSVDGKRAITRGWIFWRKLRYKLQEKALAKDLSISDAASVSMSG